MILYKMTDENDRTRHGTQWGEGVEHKADGQGDLYSEHWLHARRDPVLAVLTNPGHGTYERFHLWEAEGDAGVEDGVTVGCTRLKTVKRVEPPQITIEQRVNFAILCARNLTLHLDVHEDGGFQQWALNWLTGEDRSMEAAFAAKVAVRKAAKITMWTGAAKAKRLTLWAASAELAVEAAVWVGWATCAIMRAGPIDDAVNPTKRAATRKDTGDITRHIITLVAWAGAGANAAAKGINFVALAKESVRE